MKRLLFIPLFCSLFLFAACTQRENVEAVDVNFEQDSAELRSDMQQRLQRIDTEINELETLNADTTTAHYADVRDRLDGIRDKRDDLREDLNRLETSTSENFRDLRARMHQEAEDLEAEITRARLDAARTREEFQSYAQTRLDEYDRWIADLEGKVSSATAEQQDDYNRTLEKLREDRQKIRDRWNEFSASTQQNWEDFRSDLASDISSLGRSIEEASDRAARELRH